MATSEQATTDSPVEAQTTQTTTTTPGSVPEAVYEARLRPGDDLQITISGRNDMIAVVTVEAEVGEEGHDALIPAEDNGWYDDDLRVPLVDLLDEPVSREEGTFSLTGPVTSRDYSFDHDPKFDPNA